MSQKKILIVDDDADVRDALRDALVTSGFAVIEATNGEEGLTRSLAEKPDLTLLDIAMPKMNGHQMLKALRLDPWGRTAPVIMLTAMDDAANVAQDVELKSDDYIIKSSESIESILKKVKQYLAGYHD